MQRPDDDGKMCEVGTVPQASCIVRVVSQMLGLLRGYTMSCSWLALTGARVRMNTSNILCAVYLIYTVHCGLIGRLSLASRWDPGAVVASLWESVPMESYKPRSAPTFSGHRWDDREL